MAWARAIQQQDRVTGLSSNKVLTIDRAIELVDRVIFDPTLRSNMLVFLRRLGGIQSDDMWDAYLTAYDLVLNYDDGYRDLMNSARKSLPTEGLIHDYGAGTGNFSLFLLKQSKDLKVSLFDFSQVALSLAKKKLQEGDFAGRVSLHHEDLKLVAPPSFGAKELADGAVLNNVLYTLPWKNKIHLLRRIFNDLKPGGTLFYSDPKMALQKSRSTLIGFLKDIAQCAVANGSPVTEAQLALLTSIHHQILTATTLHFTPVESILDLAVSMGFEHVKTLKDSQHGQTEGLILRKPETHQACFPLQRQRQVDLYFGRQGKTILPVVQRALKAVEYAYRQHYSQPILDLIQRENERMAKQQNQLAHFVITDSDAKLSAYQMLFGARSDTAATAKLPLEVEFPHLKLNEPAGLKCELKRVFCSEPDSSCQELLTALAIFLSKKNIDLSELKIYTLVANERLLNYYVEELGFEKAFGPAELQREGHWVAVITGEKLLSEYFPITRRHLNSARLMQTVAAFRAPLELRPKHPIDV